LIIALVKKKIWSVFFSSIKKNCPFLMASFYISSFHELYLLNEKSTDSKI